MMNDFFVFILLLNKPLLSEKKYENRLHDKRSIETSVNHEIHGILKKKQRFGEYCLLVCLPVLFFLVLSL